MRTCSARSVRWTTKSSTSAPVAVDRLGADARRARAATSATLELGDEAAQLGDEGAAAGGVADLGEAGAPEAAGQPPGARARRGSSRDRAGGPGRAGRRRGRRPSAPRGRAAPRRRSSASGARRGRAGRDPAPGRCWRGPARGARGAGAGSRRGRGRSAARPARRPPPRAGRTRRPRSSTTKPASVAAPRVLDARCVSPPRPQPAHPAAGGDRPPPRRLDVRGVGRGDPAEVDDARSSGECSAATPRACGSISAISSGLDPPQAGNLVGRARGARARRAGPARPRRRRRSACRPLRASIPRSLAVGVEQAGALDAEPRLQRARLVVDAGVDHAARVGWSGGRASRSSRSSTQRLASGVAGEQLARHREARGCRRR